MLVVGRGFNTMSVLIKSLFIALVFQYYSSAKCHHCPKSVTTVSGNAIKFGEICQGQLIFEDDFNDLNENIWQHEITVGGGGVSLTLNMMLYTRVEI